MATVENIPQPARPAYRLKKKFLPAFGRKVLFWLNRVFVFFSLKDSRQYWGIVYDSVSKQPLDPVIVKLLYVDGREAETCVTDLSGRYGFLARPGKFKIFVKKSNYAFPSKYAEGSSDGVYDNLYHGEFFELRDGSEVIAPNIPMDPTAKDWNQQAKRGVVSSYPYLKRFAKMLVAVMFWFGFISAVVFFSLTFPEVKEYFYWAIGAYLFLIVSGWFTPETRLWGRLILPKNILPDENIYLELRNEKFTQVSFGKARLGESGKFLLRANSGSYMLTVNLIDKNKQVQELANTKVSVGALGVYNGTFKLKAGG